MDICSDQSLHTKSLSRLDLATMTVVMICLPRIGKQATGDKPRAVVALQPSSRQDIQTSTQLDMSGSNHIKVSVSSIVLDCIQILTRHLSKNKIYSMTPVLLPIRFKSLHETLLPESHKACLEIIRLRSREARAQERIRLGRRDDNHQARQLLRHLEYEQVWHQTPARQRRQPSRRKKGSTFANAWASTSKT